MEFSGTVIGLSLTGQAEPPTLAGGKPDPIVEVKVVLTDSVGDGVGMLQCRVVQSKLGTLSLGGEVSISVLSRDFGLSLIGFE